MIGDFPWVSLVVLSVFVLPLLLGLLHYGFQSVIVRLRVLGRTRSLYAVFAAWTMLYFAESQWVIEATGTVNLNQIGVSDLVRGMFLASSLLISSWWLVAYGPRPLRPLLRAPLFLFTAFGAWSVLTVLWTTSIPATAYKSVEYMATLLLVSTVAFVIRSTSTDSGRWGALKRLFDWHWMLHTISLTGVFTGILFWPHLALQPGLSWLPWQLRGVMPAISSNGVGELAATVLLVCINRMLAIRAAPLAYCLVATLSVCGIVLAQSRSAFIGLAAGLLVLIIYNRAWSWLAFLAAGVTLILSTQLQSLLTAYIVRGRPTTISTLTGRTEWWDAAFTAMQDRPLEGFGAFAGGKHVLMSRFGIGTSTLHNAFVEAWAGTGAVGLILFTGALLVMAIMLFRSRPGPDGQAVARLVWAEAAAIFALLLVRSVFSVSFLWPPMLSSAILLVLLSVLKQPLPGDVTRAASKPSGQVRRAEPT